MTELTTVFTQTNLKARRAHIVFTGFQKGVILPVRPIWWPLAWVRGCSSRLTGDPCSWAGESAMTSASACKVAFQGTLRLECCKSSWETLVKMGNIYAGFSSVRMFPEHISFTRTSHEEKVSWTVDIQRLSQTQTETGQNWETES